MRSNYFGAWLPWLALLGLAGGVMQAPAQTTEVILFSLTNAWRYNQTISYNGTNWTAPGFNDTNLPSGRGALMVEDAGNPFALSFRNTILTLGRTTYYFRTHFNFAGSTQSVSLTFSNLIDDGAVFHLNGREVARVNLPAAPTPITYTNLATNHDATTIESFTLSGAIVETNLVPGDNVLAVEVHQTTAASTDIVFGLALSATVPETNPPPTLRMPAALPTVGYSLTNAFGNLAFVNPLALATPPGETNRLFIVEQAGRVAVITNLAAPNRTVFLDLSARVRTTENEEGLLGLAFHPGYSSNRSFFVYYTITTNAAGSGRHQILSRFQVSATNPNAADPNSETNLLRMHDEAFNHNGGDLHFGPDGYLYVSLGDEGAANDSLQNSQRIDKDFWASMLRLDVDVPARPESLMPNPHPANTNNPGGVIHYRVPPDNPFVGVTTWFGTNVVPSRVRTEFYAVGLRNPWRFSFDPVTGFLYCGDVGQGAREEIDIIVIGGNYGWNFREGLIARPGSGTPPAGFSAINPIQDYGRGNGPTQGASVTGGVVYRGSRIPALYGAYVFADYVSGNVWSLRYDGTNTLPFTRLTGDGGIAAFGLDPRNGDILTADQSEDRIKRLIYDTNISVGASLPATLFWTGAFTNLSSLADSTTPLTPNAGLIPYDLNVPFWSDNARKGRWFFRPATNNAIGFSREANWSFPAGMAWVKHFDLELTNGVPASSRRLETRILVRDSNGVYGVTYRWGGSLTNATLVGDAGMDEAFTVRDGGILRTQIWHYPSRTECLVCHTPVGGHALGFNTAQLNRDFDYGGGPTNQIDAFRRAGYFSSGISNLHALRSLSPANDESASLEWRVRSYLSANCAQCHQPGGSGQGSWNASLTNTTAGSGLIHGALINNGGDTNNRVVTPGSLARSMLLARLTTNGPSRMPPLATSLLDPQAIALLSAWITNDLPADLSFADWQTNYFGSSDATNALADADPDNDGALNRLEWLTDTDPTISMDAWRIGIRRSNDLVEVEFPRLANRAFEVQWTAHLTNGAPWFFLNTPENRPLFPSAPSPAVVPDRITNGPARFYRVRVFEP